MNKPLFSVLLSSTEGHAIAEADGNWLLARSPGTTPE